MKLTAQTAVPVFRLKDVFGRTIDLNNYRNSKILIAFFRHAGCPFCNLRVHALTKIYPEMRQNGLEMIFFFESKETIIRRSTFHQGVSPIPLISDPEKVWYSQYGLEQSMLKSGISHLASFVQTAWRARAEGVPVHLMADGESINTMPAEFLISHDLMIERVLYSQRLNERLDLEEIKQFARR